MLNIKNMLYISNLKTYRIIYIKKILVGALAQMLFLLKSGAQFSPQEQEHKYIKIQLTSLYCQ